MREIKFDAIYKPTGEHFVPCEIDFNNNIVTGSFDGKDNDWCLFSLDGKYGDVILRQYTGLKDKNGKEIYERDILGAYDEKPLYVKWSEEHAAFVFVDYFDPFGTTILTTDDISYEAFEIIGNIYEDKHLLEGASE